jgi:hypothetical protein
MQQWTIEQADIQIDLAAQKLYLPRFAKSYSISSGKNGIGEIENSGKTPRGWHKVAQKIGADTPLKARSRCFSPVREVIMIIGKLR